MKIPLKGCLGQLAKDGRNEHEGGSCATRSRSGPRCFSAESRKISIFVLKVLKFFRRHCPTQFFVLIANMASDSPYDLGKIEKSKITILPLQNKLVRGVFGTGAFRGLTILSPLGTFVLECRLKLIIQRLYEDHHFNMYKTMYISCIPFEKSCIT